MPLLLPSPRLKPLPVIAIVEDDESVCRALVRLLQYAGMDACGFRSAQAFLDAMADTSASPAPDCALIDVQMPGMNGLDLHEEILRLGTRVPVIFMTAHDSLDVRLRASQQGAAAYLTKPLTRSVLLEAIGAAVNGPREARERDLTT